MRHGILVCLSVLFVSFGRPSAVWSQDQPLAEVSAALDELHQWLGNDANARNWRVFLRSDDLAAQLAQGNAADPETVQAIRARYESSEYGLQLGRFQAVRAALEKWTNELQMPISDLPAAARAAKEGYRPVQQDLVARSRANLDGHLRRLDQWLRSSDQDKAAEWRSNLQWDNLQEELAKGNEARPDVLDRIADSYGAETKELESAPLVEARRSLQDYAQALRISSDPKLQETYSTRMDDLAKRFEGLAESPKLQDVAAAGRTLGWLERAGQSSRVISAARVRFGRPNVFATASERLVAAAFDDPEAKAKMNQPQGLVDNILGTALYGTVYPNLNMIVSLIPSDERATIDVQFHGTATSRNTGYRGPVTVWTNGFTQIAARKHIYFDADGASASGTGASCVTSSTIQSIAANCRLIEKIAWNQAGKQKGQAEAVASAHAESRLAYQIDSEMGGRLADANQRYAERFRDQLLRRNSFPRVFQVSSTDSAVLVHILHATGDQLSTASEPPELTGSHDLALRLHETGVANFGETLIGGETLTDERLVEMLEESKTEVPEELKITEDKDPWSITFARHLPVSAQFSGDEVKMAIRGSRFTRGEQVVRDDIEIAAAYKLEKSGSGSKLTRQGDVTVEYVNRKQLSVRQVAMKTFFQKKFDALFKPEIESDGLKLPNRFQNLGKLQLQQLNADQGWLTLGWIQSSSNDADKVASAD